MISPAVEATKKNKDLQKPTVRRRAALVVFLEFVAIFAAGLLVLEVCMNVAGVADEEFLDIEPVTGWTHMPGRSYTYRTEGYAQSVINSHGMRDKERTLAKPADTYRIAVMGCSMTEGTQVPIRDNFCSLLEDKLNASMSGRKIEVLNFGVSAYSLGQEYMRLKHLALKFKPDLVIFTARPNSLLYMGHDPKQGFFNARPIFGIAGDGSLIEDRNFQKHWLASSEGQRKQATRWLRYHSRLWGVIGKSSAQITLFKEECQNKLGSLTARRPEIPEKPVQAPQSAAAAKPVDSAGNQQSLNSAQMYLGKVAEALVKASNAASKNAGSKFILVYLPSTLKQRDLNEQKIFSEIASNLSLPFLDMNPQFDLLEKRDHKPLYFRTHFSKEGHEQVAESLYAKLRGCM